MPYTNPPPPFVLPYTAAGIRYAEENFESDLELDIEFCTDYKDGSDMTRRVTDLFLPIGIPPCKNRRRDGERYFNWCYRCMAGFPAVSMTDKEKSQTRDSLSI